MKTRFATRLYTALGATMAFVLLAAPAHAQYKPRPLNDPATGESYHIEASASWWFSSADMVFASGGSGALTGIAGTSIDGKKDLGLQDEKFPIFKLVLRASQRNKFRAEVIPIKFDAQATLKKDIVFNGQRYATNLPVNTTLDWKAYRLAYEFDFVSTNRGFGGIILEAKYTDVEVQIASPVRSDHATARAPIPALGGIARVYVVPNISITGELTGLKIPADIVKDFEAHYFDFDIYGTVNFTNNIGLQAGYRSLDVGYLLKTDTGSFTLRGQYVGVVARY